MKWIEELGLDDRVDVDCIQSELAVGHTYIASDLEFIHSSCYYVRYTKMYSASWILNGIFAFYL